MVKAKFLFAICLEVFCANAFTHTNFYIKKIDNCDLHNRSKLYYHFYVNDNDQYCDFDATFPVVLDHRVGARFTVESTVNEEHYTQLISIYENNYCSAVQRFGGEFWYDFQRAMQLNPGSCPIPKRRYKVVKHKLTFSRISLQTFPFGKLRLTVKVMENANKNVVFCLKGLIDNKAN